MYPNRKTYKNMQKHISRLACESCAMKNKHIKTARVSLAAGTGRFFDVGQRDGGSPAFISFYFQCLSCERYPSYCMRL